MKGQRLFVRELTPADLPEARQIDADFTFEEGDVAYVAKLVGSPAAVTRLQLADGEAHLTALCVRPELRRLRIGSKFLAHVTTLLPQTVTRLTIRKGLLPTEFLTKSGFREQGDDFRLDLAR